MHACLHRSLAIVALAFLVTGVERAAMTLRLVALLLCVRCAAAHNRTHEHRGPVIFLDTIGLEHTGHHLWEDIARRAVADDRIGKAISTARSKLAIEHINGLDGWFRTINNSDIMNSRMSYYARGLLREAMLKDGARTTTRANPNRVSYIGSCSYPCGGLNDLPLRNPSIMRVVAVERSIGVAPRFIVMLRPPHELVHTFTLARVELLAKSCAALEADVLSLRPHEFMCSNYSETAQNAEALSAFIGANLTHYIRTGYVPTARQRRSYDQLRESKLELTPAWAELESCHRRVQRVCSLAVRERPGVRGVELEGWSPSPRRPRRERPRVRSETSV